MSSGPDTNASDWQRQPGEPPRPGDGPDYHAELAFWKEHHPEPPAAPGAALMAYHRRLALEAIGRGH